MNGSKLTALAIKHIEKVYNGYVINTIATGKSGTADLIACIDGTFFAFEIKGKGDKPKPLQDCIFDRVMKAGGYGGYVYKLADIDFIVNNLSYPIHNKAKAKINL